ncbi:MAG: C39 family peptidase [Clostridia bacterium]|nr:C39 family peptidase [Clostridia bacterium]
MKKTIIIFMTVSVLLFCGCSALRGRQTPSAANTPLIWEQEMDTGNNQEKLQAYLASLPDEIRELYERNPDTAEFVFYYNAMKGEKGKIDMSGYMNGNRVPLFMQWDRRWGYMDYSGSCVAVTGCGPVCLSMVAFYLTRNAEMSPDRIVEFAIEEGYSRDGCGSLWTLISEGGEKLGLCVEELVLSEAIITERLEQGIPIICVMGPGDFTSTGHFIVMRGYSDGKIYINDPNSYQNSAKGWEYGQIKSQIKNLWAVTL